MSLGEEDNVWSTPAFTDVHIILKFYLMVINKYFNIFQKYLNIVRVLRLM